MGISISICELEAKNASCRELKQDVEKILLKDISGFENAADVDMIVSLEDAKTCFSDWPAFLKRNRINEETDAIYIDKIKNDEDADMLSDFAKSRFTGWVSVKKMDADSVEKALKESSREDRVTGWDMLSFDEMNDKCTNCPLSWDKKRGCIGAFGPDNSLLPEIASRNGCPIVASIPDGAKAGRKYTPEDGIKLSEEVDVLTAALPNEGKVMVRRYSGPLERLAAVAKISVDENCGFFFF